jgi:hypothetical protein
MFSPVTINSIGGNATTTKTVNSRALTQIFTMQHDGADSVADIAANGNVFCVAARVGSAMRSSFLVDEDGDYWYDGADGGAFDAIDDLDALRSFSIVVSDTAQIIQNEFDDFLKTNEDDLVNMRVLGDTVANGGLVNGAQLQRLHTGAIGQLSNKHMSLVEEVADLKTQLKALTEAK